MSPPAEYDGSVCVVVEMLPVTTITVATCSYLLLKSEAFLMNLHISIVVMYCVLVQSLSTVLQSLSLCTDFTA